MLVDCFIFHRPDHRHILNALAWVESPTPTRKRSMPLSRNILPTIRSNIFATCSVNPLAIRSTLILCVKTRATLSTRNTLKRYAHNCASHSPTTCITRLSETATSKRPSPVYRRLKTANTYVAPIMRQVKAWNAMVERNIRFAQWCKSSECYFTNIRTSSNMLTKINSFNL